MGLVKTLELEQWKMERWKYVATDCGAEKRSV